MTGDWREKAAKEIQDYCKTISEAEMAMGDMPDTRKIVAIIDKHLEELRQRIDTLTSLLRMLVMMENDAPVPRKPPN